MPTPFIMPKMDMDQETVTINEWLKKEGEVVQKGEPVLVIETDKITSEVEAPASGTLARVLYGENEEAPVTEVIAYILNESETEADLPERTEPKTEESVNHRKSTLTEEEKPIASTSVARRLAAEKGVSLADIPPSGGKITKKDVETFLQNQSTVSPRVKTPATPAARRLADENGIDIDEVQGSGPRGRVQADDVRAFASTQAPALFQPEYAALRGETQAFTGMRKSIAERITNSYQSIPHIYLDVDVDMKEAEASRQRMNELAQKDGLAKISLTAYLIRIVSWCLNRHPHLNATLKGDEILFWKDINIGIATALENGLIVPVIHHTDQKSTREVNERLRELTSKARKGELSREEIQDGTFTISNLGMYGIHSFTTIINPPQSALLAVGALRRQPIVVDDEDTVEVRPVMAITLAADHRIVDGVVAANFLSELVQAIETPELLLL